MENIRVAHVPYDYIDNHPYGEWLAMSLDDIAKEDGVEIYTIDGFQDAFNVEYISDLSYIFFKEIK